jgi:hypothetical protein
MAGDGVSCLGVSTISSYPDIRPVYELIRIRVRDAQPLSTPRNGANAFHISFPLA